jgi:hypothetical protein
MLARIAAFRKGLKALGWTEDGNLQIDIRQYGGDLDHIRVAAKEMVRLSPEVIVAYGPPGVAALRLETRTIPIVLRKSAIRSVRALSPACSVLAGTSPVSAALNWSSVENGFRPKVDIWARLRRQHLF